MKIGPIQLHQYAPPGSRASVRPSEGAGPVDGVHVQDAGEAGETHSPMSLAKVGLAAGLAVASLAGVAGMVGLQQSAPPTPPPTHQSQPARAGNEAATALQQQNPQDSMKFQVLPEGLGRVDLIRENDRHPDAEDGGKDVYSPLGVYLGDGIFHDLNNNLVLVPGAAFPDYAPVGANKIKVDNKWSSGYEVIEKGDGLLVDGALDQTITRHGDTVEVDGPLFADFQVQESQDGVRVHGPLGANLQMRRQGDTIEVQGRGSHENYTVKREGNTLHIDGPGDHDLTVRREGNRIVVESPKGETRITRDGNRISVEGAGTNQTLERDGNAVKLSSSFFRGSRTVYGP